jgi:hypothetical protein
MVRVSAGCCSGDIPLFAVESRWADHAETRYFTERPAFAVAFNDEPEALVSRTV